jgi:predicted MFS family arabinose efflux permease
VAFGRRPLIILSAILMSVGTLWAGFTNDYHQLLGGICLTGLAGGATLSVVCYLEYSKHCPTTLTKSHRPSSNSST